MAMPFCNGGSLNSLSDHEMEKTVKKRYIKLIALTVLTVACILFLNLSGKGTKANAASNLWFEQDKYTVYEGNTFTLNLIYNGEEMIQQTDDFWYYGVFSSSDESVASVSYSGEVVCQGTGKCVITAYYLDMSVKCTVKVKANKMDLSTEEDTLYSHQEVKVTASGIKNASSYSCDIHRIDDDESWLWDDMPEVNWDGKGGFSIKAGRKGDYRIRLIIQNKKGVTYSKNFILHTIEAGPSTSDLSIAVGGSKEIGMANSDIVSVELKRWYEPESNYYHEAGESGCPIESDNTGKFTAKGEGTAIYSLSYMVDDGSILETELTVSGYVPEYRSFGSYLWVGQYYYPYIENSRWNAEIRITSSNPDVVTINNAGEIVPMSGGKATLTIWVDGMTFIDDIEVIDAHINSSNILTWPGTKFSFAVSGIPAGMKVTYSSSDESVATISKKGKLKTKKVGFTKITVKIDDMEYYYTVNVGQEIPVEAAIAASEVVGKATYSQDRRMEEGFYDCSSLVWRSYAKAGIRFVHEDYAPTAADLAKYMEDNGYTISYGLLPTSEMQPGDILFTSSGYDNGRFMKIDHVAMYYSTEDLYDTDVPYGYDYLYEGSDGYGTIVHAGKNGGGVYYSGYPYGSVVMIARINPDDFKK